MKETLEQKIAQTLTMLKWFDSIKDERMGRHANLTSNKRLYEEYEDLVNQWERYKVDYPDLCLKVKLKCVTGYEHIKKLGE